MRILLVEDDPILASEIAGRLRREGLVVDAMGTLADSIEAVTAADYQLVILDRRLPDGEGLALIPVLKTKSVSPPVIALSALDDVCERIAGLEAGAEDYLIKPFVFEELLARIRVLLRRDLTPAVTPLPVTIGSLVYDLSSREVAVAGVPLVLPRRELAILDVLARRAGRVVMREYLESAIYGFDEEVNSNAMEAQISTLRRRLARADAGVVLQAVRGLGYTLRAAP